MGFTPVNIEGENIRLVPMSIGHAEELYEILQDPRFAETTTIPWPYTKEMAYSHLNEVADAWDKGEPDWAITCRKTGELLGRINLFSHARIPHCFEIAFMTRSDQWGRGIMTQAVRLAVATAFDHFQATRIEWFANVGNWGSWKPVWRCGFQREGITRRDAGKFWVASLLKEDRREPASPWDGPQKIGLPALEYDSTRPAQLVTQFHTTYSMPNRVAEGERPTLDFDRLDMRMSLISEEFAELTGAVYGPQARKIIEDASAKAKEISDHTHDVVEAADALADLVYVIYGMALESGIDLNAVLDEVQASNLSKLMPDGSVLLREDGKVLKGPNFFPPNVRRALKLDE
ncbi:GNAT family N-acetyltransferase [Schaalia sp. lx-100]|uniref:GNAT family N-acetyltransferase n=1 Tax=Schaalia sp. lx-100 TaxID=2899081 RepID=UPI001E2AEC55|nr:GNAT family N-acetyltransferase [Schaalia sp. lx-100]MCD4558155.1 GNAT family N-acetyltransferase [Schaalia sp. lx-100]